MNLYNTLTKTIEPLQPIDPPNVSIYTCGPTVYDYPHVGNWFTFIRYDLLVRTLQASGLHTNWVMNITDVGHLVSDADDGEDKLEKGAKREGKTAWDVAQFYSDYFVSALSRLNFVQPNHLPKATEHIAEQIALIQILENKGYTYVITDGVYFDTAKFPTYASFAGLDLDEQQDGARVEQNPEKRNASDFALWKFAPADQKRDMEWDSPWGKGFPGWHIECSAMSKKYLGDTIDIHSGGIDHIPVHHTNEVAQSEAATGKQFAKHWMHTNHILINDEKISKSLGNGITLEQIETNGFSLSAFRLHVLESHYRSQSKFSWDSLQSATNRLIAYQAMADLRWQTINNTATYDFADLLNQILEPLSNDLNTPQALAALSAIESQLSASLVSAEQADDFSQFLQKLDAALGTKLALSSDISEEQKILITHREEARQAQDWTLSDTLRVTLAEQGIGVRDTQHGAVWYRMHVQ